MRSALYYSVLPAAFSFSRRPPGEDATLQLSYFSYNNKNEKRKFHFLLFLFLFFLSLYTHTLTAKSIYSSLTFSSFAIQVCVRVSI